MSREKEKDIQVLEFALANLEMAKEWADADGKWTSLPSAIRQLRLVVRRMKGYIK